MLGYELIKKSVVSKLKILNIPIVASEIREGFSKPSFFVQLMPIGELTDNNISTNTLTINIHYFSADKTDLDNLKMLTQLRKIFVNSIEVEDRVLTLYDKRYDLYDNVLQFRFDLRYTEEIEVDDNHDLIEELVLNI